MTAFYLASRHKHLTIALFGTFVSGHSYAGGFAVPEASIFGAGMSNAVVANPDEVGAFAYNPAAMAFHDKSSVSLGFTGVSLDLSVTNSTGKHDNQAKNVILIPVFNGHYRFSDSWSFGLNVGTPFGLETNWKPGTFPALSSFPASLTSPTKSNLQLIAFSPTVTYKINDHLAVSVGGDYYNAFGINLNTSEVDIKASGESLGWNTALLAKTERLSFGLSFHSSTTISADGKFQSGILTSGFTVPAKAGVNLPWRLQAGIRIKASKTIAIEFDYNRTGWSSFDEIVVKSKASDATLTSSTSNWKDSNTYRIGASWQASNSTQLRLGYSYDETPQTKSGFSSRTPDANRQLFSLGIGQQFGKGWELEASYMYVMFDDNNFQSNTVYSGPPADPNGTDAFNGKYESSVHIFGIGVNKTFL